MRKIISIVLAVVLALPLLAVTPSAADDSTHITAEINKNSRYVQITGTFSSADVQTYKDVSLSLFAVAPGENIGDTPALEKNIKARKNVSYQVSLSDRRRCAFVLAYENSTAGYIAVTNYAYISNQDNGAPNTYEQPGVKSKKGLKISLFADAQLLGISHATITVPLNEYILTTANNAVTYRQGGMAYYFDKNKTAVLDHTVKTYSDAGIRVYLQLVLTKRQENQPEYLYFDKADNSADYFAVNTYSKQACDALYAFVSYLTEKYTSAERVGFCGNFILGSEVNSNRYKNSAGPMSLTEYTDVYAKALRIVDSAARSVYSNAGVYVSVVNNFNKPSPDSNADPMLDFSVLDFLTHLADNINNGGDIPWRVSVDPYNIDRNKADFRGAEGSEYSYDAKYVTMDNINILTSLLSQPAYLYNGQRRPVIIGEISYTSGNNTADEQKAQAAAYSFAYYKAEANEQIEAFIYACHVDDSKNNNSGLYEKVQGTENTASNQKSIYRVVRYIDTDYSSVITEPYLSFYGLISWGEEVSGYNASRTSCRTVLSGSASTEGPEVKKEAYKRLTDFNSAELTFYPSENARLITTENDKKAEELYGSVYSLTAELNAAPLPEYRGVSSNFNMDISNAEYAVLDMKLDMADKSGVADVMLRFIGKDENGVDVIYEGIAAVTLGQYYRLYFDLTEYKTVCKNNVQRVSVWVKPHKDSDNGEYKLLVNGISLIESGGGTSFGSVVKTVIIVTIVIVTLAAAAYGIMYLRAYIIYKRKKKKLEEKRRKVK